MSQISLDDIQKDVPPEIIENFMSDLFCNSTRIATHSTSEYGGLKWNHTRIVDDFNYNLRINNAMVCIEDENSVEGQALTHAFEVDDDGKASSLVPPVTLKLAEHYEHLGAVAMTMM